MPTTTWNCNKDARIARRVSDGWDAGSGTSDGLPVGRYGGYQYRALIGFSYSFTGMTSIISATLHYKTSNQIHVAFGSSPSVRWQRITSSWSEGTSNGLSASNAVIYPGPSVDATGADDNISNSESTWGSDDITALIQEAFAAGVFYGIRGIAWDGSGESSSASDVIEFFSSEYSTSSDMYITVEYSTVTVPEVPTVVTPTAGGYTGDDTTPDLTWKHHDDDGNAADQYQVQVATVTDFSATVFDSGTVVAAVADNANFTVTCTTTLTRGTQYYHRARTHDGSGWGPWSSATAFKVPQAPTVTLTEPSATGRLGKLSYTGGSGWASPRLNLEWTFSCPDGGTQSSYDVNVNNDSAGAVGSALYTATAVTGTATSFVVPTTLTEGAYYHVRVRVTCSHGVVSTYSGYFRIRTRWGVGTYRKDLGSTPTSWSITTLLTTTTASSAVVVEYGSDSAANASPSSGYKGTLGEAPLARYFYYRTWLLAWGSSPATSPNLYRMILSYSATVLVPDKWTRQDTTNSIADPGSYVYGTQSLKMAGKGSQHNVYQLVQVTPNTDYVLSARLKTSGSQTTGIILSDSGTGGTTFASYFVGGTQDWTRINTQVWNSGSNSEVYVRCVQNGAVGTTAWFDAVKMEASRVVTPWSPSFLAEAVVLDAGGLQIDGAAGGIFRLRGSNGGTRDRVDLGVNGLKFGGDLEVASLTSGILSLASGAAAISGKKPVVRVYTAGATWTKPADISHIIVEVVGGGGGGGGVTASATAGHWSMGGGGAGGGYARKLFTAADLASLASASVTVGAGGTGGTGASGASGGTSSFAGTGITTVQATGGTGGSQGSDRTTDVVEGVSPTGGVGTGGDVNVAGTGPTTPGMRVTFPISGGGGHSLLGAGANPIRLSSTGTSTVGGSPTGGYGGAGSGAATNASATNAKGGDGADGVVIVTEFYGP